jgi:putative ATPase
MRPRSLDEYIGQEEIAGPGRRLRRATPALRAGASVEADRLFSSILLWGPPGTGKTTLAQIIANSTKSYLAVISAVLSGIPELRKVICVALYVSWKSSFSPNRSCTRCLTRRG